MPVLVVARLGAYGDGDHASGWDPDSVQAGWADQAREAARRAGRLPAVPRVQLVSSPRAGVCRRCTAGLPPASPGTLALMEAFMDQPGLVPDGLYHELYLSDMRETAPQKMRTILRQPVRAA
jgi:hypothetical protein